ncbi:phosphoribosyltransferase [Synechococcus sp. PCC 7336]|uniref:phosphoribosyltransferase n=1 Tax=Synechococcus sp. PCC 7336 TaxID=195250 RepID=UPI000345A577|nr:phosphoribosyltransferase [Synechococcus sp. PCC 7336]
MTTAKFVDRIEAGQLLAVRLQAYANHPNAIVLGLPRGGVPVAFEIATALHLPLDICLARKLGVPGQEELAMGAIAPGGIQWINWDLVSQLGISAAAIEPVLEREQQELARREQLYRGNRPFPNLTGKTVLLVDDGIATGATFQAAIATLRQYHPREIIAAVPVAPLDTCRELQREVDRLICLRTPEPFYAIGLWYDHFDQTCDREVQQLLEWANQSLPASDRVAVKSHACSY